MCPIAEAKKQQVIQLLNDGHSTRAIVSKNGVSKGTISRISQSLPSSRPKAKGGRPPLLTRHEKKFCVLEIMQGRKETAAEVRSSLEEVLGVKASDATVRRALKEGGLRAVRTS